MIAALLVWVGLDHTSTGRLYYALFGFRFDAVSALTNTNPGSKLAALGTPALHSGLIAGLAFAAAGIGSLRRRGRPIVAAVLAAWLAAGLVGIVLGGSYWHHYLIQIVPVVVAGAATVFARHRRVAALAVAAMAAPAFATAGLAVIKDSPDLNQLQSVTVGQYIKAHALPGQTVHVIYAHVNVLYYSGLPDPFPYNWSLMMRAEPGAQKQLRSLLASPARPTWVVKWQSTRGFGLDRSGATLRLLHRHYRRFATVCGHPLLLERGAAARPTSAGPPASCRQPAGDQRAQSPSPSPA
jgi:hypothetical protein